MEDLKGVIGRLDRVGMDDASDLNTAAREKNYHQQQTEDTAQNVDVPPEQRKRKKPRHTSPKATPSRVQQGRRAKGRAGAPATPQTSAAGPADDYTMSSGLPNVPATPTGSTLAIGTPSSVQTTAAPMSAPPVPMFSGVRDAQASPTAPPAQDIDASSLRLRVTTISDDIMSTTLQPITSLSGEHSAYYDALVFWFETTFLGTLSYRVAFDPWVRNKKKPGYACVRCKIVRKAKGNETCFPDGVSVACKACVSTKFPCLRMVLMGTGVVFEVLPEADKSGLDAFHYWTVPA